MRRLTLLALDLGLVCVATLFSFVVRENFEVDPGRFLDFLPYLIATMASTSVVFLSIGLNRSIWRFSSRPDYVRIMLASTVVIVGAVSLTFAYNRLEGVARSLPVLQLLACQAFLIGARVLHKISHDARQRRKASSSFLQLDHKKTHTAVLVVGVSKLTEAYLQGVADLAADRIVIAGLVGQVDRYVGRLMATYPVLGVPAEIEHILDGLEVHGVTINRIVVTFPFSALTEIEREALLCVERSRNISLQFLTEALGLDGDEPDAPSKRQTATGMTQISELSFEILPAEIQVLARQRYWTLKRMIDCFAALAAITLGFPLIAFAAAAAAASVGFPILFWQQRPGLGGKPFRLYKFRSMKAAHSADGRRLSDKERVSRVGALLRRLRVDELPQFFNVLRGDMSLIGPRPLLASEQSEASRARLLVRPGITGWAQVVGGRDVSPQVKAALDVWYVQHACLALDLEILARTVRMVVLGERISRPLIERAWRDLSDAGVLQGELACALTRKLDINVYPA